MRPITRDSYASRRRPAFPGPSRRPASSPQVLATGLLADYRFGEGSGTTLTDHSGNGNHGTLGTGVNAPTWVAGGGLRFAQNTQVSLPLTCAQAVSVQTVVKLDAGQPGFPVILGSDQNTWGHWLNNGYDQSNFSANVTAQMWLPATWENGFYSTSNDFMTEGSTALLSLVSTSGQDIYYVNDGAGQPGNNRSSLSGRTGNLFIGMAPFYSTNNSVGLTGTIYRLLIYSAALAQSDVASNYAVINGTLPAAAKLPQYSPSTGRIYAAEGDSITAGAGISNSWPLNMTLANTYDRTNFGISGQLLATMLASGFDKIKMKYAPNGARNVVSLFGGTNDLAGGGGSDASTTFDNLTTLVGKYTAQGWGVVVVPMISRTGTGTGGATSDSLKNSYNSLIWGNAWGANVKVVPANDAHMGSGASFNFFADGSYSNTTYYQSDGVHPSQAGADLIGQAVAAQVNAFG